MITKNYKIYGVLGHRQRASFGKTFSFSTSRNNKPVYVSCFNSDYTGTNDYSILAIMADDEEAIQEELYAQIDDGIFENCNVGSIEEIEHIVFTR